MGFATTPFLWVARPQCQYTVCKQNGNRKVTQWWRRWHQLGSQLSLKKILPQFSDNCPWPKFSGQFTMLRRIGFWKCSEHLSAPRLRSAESRSVGHFAHPKPRSHPKISIHMQQTDYQTHLILSQVSLTLIPPNIHTYLIRAGIASRLLEGKMWFRVERNISMRVCNRVYWLEFYYMNMIAYQNYIICHTHNFDPHHWVFTHNTEPRSSQHPLVLHYSCQFSAS